MIIFSHSKDSSLFSYLPIELVQFIIFFLPIISNDSIITLQNSTRPLRLPHGIKYSPQINKLFVSNNHEIHVIEKDLSKEIFKFGGNGSANGHFNNPTGIELSTKTQQLYICDTSNNRIQVFDLEGHFLSAFGTFNKPLFLSYSEHEQHLYVTDACNDKVQVIDENGQSLFHFGQKGSQPSQFSLPSGVFVSKVSDKLFISDSGNHRIQVFTKQGEYLYSFGIQGTERGMLNLPKGISVDEEENVFVVDFNNHRIQVFDVNGNFLLSFGEADPHVSTPGDIDIDDEKNIYVCDLGFTENSNTIQIWKQS